MLHCGTEDIKVSIYYPDYDCTELRAMDNNSNFTIGDDINGPLLATVIVIEICVSLIANLFVLIVTFCNIKVLKQSSNIFLTNLILGNLFMTIFYLPSIAVTAAAGEWVFGTTLEQKNGFCDFFGCLYLSNVFFLVFTLTTISVDRFLFIVKPLLHKRVMNTKVTVGIAIGTWIASGVLSLLGFAQGYLFNSYVVSCLPDWRAGDGGFDLFALFSLTTVSVIIVCVIIIVITTVWTFCFTKQFLHKLKQQATTTVVISAGREDSTHVYDRRVFKLVGMFGSLLALTVVLYTPGTILFSVGIVAGRDKIASVYTTGIVVVFYFSGYIFHPLVQSYFRKEQQEFIIKLLYTIHNCCH